MTEQEAWHAAKATLGTDEKVAQRLEDVADLAAARGGFSSRARVLVQSSALSPPGPRKYARLVRAAEAALSSGTAQLAKTLIDEIDEELLDPVSRGRLIALGADYALFTSTPAVVHGTEEMVAAAALFHGEDDELEQRSLIRAWECALPSERLTTGPTWTELGERFLAGAEVREGPAATILRAMSALLLLPYAEAVPILREAVQVYEAMDTEELVVYGQSSISADHGADGPGRAAPLPRAVRCSRSGCRFSTATRQRSLGTVDVRGVRRHAASGHSLHGAGARVAPGHRLRRRARRQCRDARLGTGHQRPGARLWQR